MTPQLWYSVSESAAMLGRTTSFIHDQIAKTRRVLPGGIPTEYLKKFGGMWFIRRDYLIPVETKPANVSKFPVNQLSEVDIERIAKRTSELVLESMYLAFRKVG